MRQIVCAAIAILLVACGVASVKDRYGNRYGGWYAPGDNYQWQLDLCENRMEQRAVPPQLRPLAMRCCMYGHGVPVNDPGDCQS